MSLALLAAGCGNSAQQQAYEEAVRAEERFTPENAPDLIAGYRRVIALEPGSTWARQAEARVQAVEARLQAAEQHKAVFQEHGVD